ncbi:MAG TPA: toll/interleukin-1 receptor domain-containing protein [Vicinamibacterales bacterium]|nr:toll/interleukin-1 receptor domain-containing protein [Vicinamibacterales bacterium]
MSLIFVSYRRQDTQSATGRLCDKLQTHFGVDQVFHDIESIDAGSDFAATIESKIAASSVVLVMIGQHWTEATGHDGQPRLFDPGDYVRLEIATALHRGIPVIPVLVEDAAMPAAADLPDGISGLSTRQAHEITEQRWQYDTDLLVTQLERYVPTAASSTNEGTSTLARTLFQSVVAWPVDFAQLLLHPRRQLLAHVRQSDAVPRAIVFFVIAHVGAAWFFVLQELVVSVLEFVLTGIPIGALILLLVVIPVHLSARLVRAPSHAPMTTMMLAYIQSVAMVLTAVAFAFLWVGLVLSNPKFASSLAAVAKAPLPIEARVDQLTALAQASMAGPFFAAFVLANAIWLYTAGWLVVASLSLRDLWGISWLRAVVFLVLVALVFTIAGALIAFAATL